jgi:hypothetical protein
MGIAIDRERSAPARETKIEPSVVSLGEAHGQPK